VIPRILHRVWVGPEPLPDEFAAYGESWRRHHPDWDMRLWTDDRLPGDLTRSEAYERLRRPSERSNIIRLELLFRFGGVYVDTDFECLRPLDPLIEGLDFFTGYLKPGRVNNAAIGSASGHPILERALRELKPRTEFGHDKTGTGPLFLNNLLREYPDVKIFPPEIFYPRTVDDRERAYAVHHAARSWKESESWKETALRVEGRLRDAQRRIEKLENAAGRRHRRTRRLRRLATLPRRMIGPR
jgi:mannosyltransferase OCH1-like enzyme